MDNEKIITLQLQLTRRKALLLLTAFFLCWRPGFLGSESLTLTTYYPAPYGGYASLLTTGQTILARDGGSVGIGIAAPVQKLHVNGNIQADRIKFPGVGGNSGISGDYYSIYQEAGGWSWPYPDLVVQYHTGIKYDAHQSYGGHRFYTGYDGTGNPAGLQMQISDQVYVMGNLNVAGAITGVCRTVQYGVNWGAGCSGTERVFGAYGDNGATVNGMMFYGGALNNPGAWTPYVSVGADKSGWLLCCRIQ